MVKKLMLMLLGLMLILPAGAETLPADLLKVKGTVVSDYDSDTLCYEIRQIRIDSAVCYLTSVWMAEPGRQIRKATAQWEESLAYPSDMVATIPGAALAINGSGYVSRAFPWIPEDYPGVSEDYDNTPLGSLTVTDGEIFRNLAGVPYVGLTLQSDGLHMHVGEDNASVLAAQPTQTWSFYEQCPLIRDGEDILDRSWTFAQRKAMRTIIARRDANNYVILTVTNRGGGLTLCRCVDFLLEEVQPQWAYNLDGGPSSALLYRRERWRILKVMHGNTSKDADVMVFTE